MNINPFQSIGRSKEEMGVFKVPNKYIDIETPQILSSL
jgi:hypothetical protein